MKQPSLLVASTLDDAYLVMMEHSFLFSWEVMTPRNKVRLKESIGQYIWTPSASDLPARARWNMRMRLSAFIDENSVEEDFYQTCAKHFKK